MPSSASCRVQLTDRNAADSCPVTGRAGAGGLHGEVPLPLSSMSGLGAVLRDRASPASSSRLSSLPASSRCPLPQWLTIRSLSSPRPRSVVLGGRPYLPAPLALLLRVPGTSRFPGIRVVGKAGTRKHRREKHQRPRPPARPPPHGPAPAADTPPQTRVLAQGRAGSGRGAGSSLCSCLWTACTWPTRRAAAPGEVALQAFRATRATRQDTQQTVPWPPGRPRLPLRLPCPGRRGP